MIYYGKWDNVVTVPLLSAPRCCWLCWVDISNPTPILQVGIVVLILEALMEGLKQMGSRAGQKTAFGSGDKLFT